MSAGGYALGSGVFWWVFFGVLVGRGTVYNSPFQNALMKSSVTQFSRVVVCRRYLCFILKSDSTSESFLKFL